MAIRDPSIPLSVAMYRAALFRKTRMLARVDALFDGFWLGVLNRDDWARFDEIHYRELKERVGVKGYRYDQDEWNLAGLHAWEAAALERHFPPGARVVVTGAGGGREVLGLLKHGFDAVGYEPHPGLVQAGSALLARQGHPGRLHLCDRDAFPAVAGGCEAIVVGWGSYTLIAGRRRRIEFLRGARVHVPTGAPILLSFFPRGAVPDEHLALVGKFANLVRRARRKEPVENGDGLSPNLVHYFKREEIASELEAAGFQLEFYERQPYGHALATAVEYGDR